MARTVSQSKAGIGGQIATGRILDTGTVAAESITLGFKPRYVKVVNVTGLVTEEWFEGMADDSGFLAIDSGAGAVDFSLITSNGITVDSNGFTIGLNTDVLVSSEQISWIAMA